MKTCTRCGLAQSLDCFYKNARTKDGRQARCKGCCREARVDRDCETEDCGTRFTGTNRFCGSCRATDRDCEGCDKSFRGATRFCRPCRATDRVCETEGCGKSFRGTTRFCGSCRATDRDCEGCGRRFTGTNRFCGSCQAKDRDCECCGTRFTGKDRLCRPCQAKDRDCEGCGTRFTGKDRLCNPCAHLLRTYNLTHADYKELLEDQGRVCATCHKPPLEGKRLAVDHDHTTGKVRGLLCGTCNIMEGWGVTAQIGARIEEYRRNGGTPSARLIFCPDHVEAP